jgi:hypothetical protein
MKSYCYLSLLMAQAALSGGLAETSASKVVFVKGKEVFSVLTDGANLKQLTDDGRYKQLPKWSADGGRIAYITQLPGALAEFDVIDASGARLTAVPIRPKESHVHGMRFVEELEWLDGTHVIFGGSANPNSCE